MARWIWKKNGHDRWNSWSNGIDAFDHGTVERRRKELFRGSSGFLLHLHCIFAATMNCASWVYVAEILPLQLRAKGNAIGTASNWVCNFVIAMITPIVIDKIAWKTYIIFTLTSGVAAIMFYFFCPETSNRSLGDIENNFLSQNTMFYGVNNFNRNPINMDEKAIAHTDHAEHVEKSERLMEDV
ncbi:hypothetical protein KL907_005420 [Ogataea polymorpha]|nr:hypothetical protein KL907_005420 [Ogataea polymorpha]